jgi:hypothetical protein
MSGFLLLLWITVLAVVVVIPFVLPWRQRVRWMVSAHCFPDPIGMALLHPGTLAEVSIVHVDRGTSGLVVHVTDEPGRSRCWRYALAGEDFTPLVTGRLERWHHTGTPLLQLSDGAESVSLHGPTSAVIGLRVSEDPGGGPPGRRQPAPLPEPDRERELLGVPA